jgi:hypothetical protein
LNEEIASYRNAIKEQLQETSTQTSSLLKKAAIVTGVAVAGYLVFSFVANRNKPKPTSLPHTSEIKKGVAGTVSGYLTKLLLSNLVGMLVAFAKERIENYLKNRTK